MGSTQAENVAMIRLRETRTNIIETIVVLESATVLFPVGRRVEEGGEKKRKGC